MKKRICSITGAAVAVFSAVTAGYALGKKEPQRSAAPIICSGILGVMVGAMIAVIPQVMETKQKLMLDTLMDEEDISLMEENISEILGNSVD